MGTVDSGTQATADFPRERGSPREAGLHSRRGREDLPAVAHTLLAVAHTLPVGAELTSAAVADAGKLNCQSSLEAQRGIVRCAFIFLKGTIYAAGEGVRRFRGAADFRGRFGGAMTFPSASIPPAAFRVPFLTRGEPAVG